MAHLRRLWLPAAITAVAAAVPALAQDTPHVKWQGDDAVDLVLDPEYAGTIRLTRDELGTLFGPGEKPFEGEEVTVTVNAGGPKGGISGPLYAFRPVWEELSGGKVNIVELPFAEHYTKMMLDLRNGTGEYDAFIVGAFWYGDIAAGNYGLPVNDFMESEEFPRWSLDRSEEHTSELQSLMRISYAVFCL